MKLKKGLALLLAAALLGAALSGCGKKNSGALGDRLRTYWFEMTVEEAYLCGEYEGYAPQEGFQLLVATLSLNNTAGTSLPMFREDFPVLWGSGEELEAADPVDAFTQAQLPDRYELEAGQSRSGLLVYEVPEDVQDFSIAFLEIYEGEDGSATEGESYRVSFTPERK